MRLFSGEHPDLGIRGIELDELHCLAAWSRRYTGCGQRGGDTTARGGGGKRQALAQGACQSDRWRRSRHHSASIASVNSSANGQSGNGALPFAAAAGVRAM